MAFAQTVHPQPVSEQVQYPFGKHEITDDFFPCFKADYEDGLGMDAEVPGLGFDFLDWGAAPALLDDDQLNACTPLATLSDESDDTLLINSASTSTLDSSCSGSGSDTPDVETAAVVPTITSSVAGPAVPQAPRTCRALQPRVWLLSGDAYESTMTRKERVQRYREKRKRRTFGKTIRYEARRAYAEVRPRIKGRFATKAEVAAMKLAAEAGIPFEC